MKRLVFVIFALFTLGCGQKEKALIRFYYALDAFGSFQQNMERYIRQFESSHGGVKIEQHRIKFEKIRRILYSKSGNERIDVFLYPNDIIGNLVEDNMIISLDNLDKSFFTNFIDVTLKAVHYREHYYGVPLRYECLTLFYNRDIVTTIPGDDKEFFKLLGKLKKDGYYNFYADFYEFYYVIPYLYGMNGSVFNNHGKVKIYSNEMIKTIKYIRKLRGYMTTTQKMGGANISAMFKTGKLAILLTGPWMISRLGDIDKIGFALIPRIKETKRWPSPYIGVQTYFITSYCKHRKAAFELIKFLTSKEIQLALAAGIGAFPTRKDAYPIPAKIKNKKVFEAFSQQMRYGVPMPNTPEMTKVWKIMNNQNLNMLFACKENEIANILKKLQESAK